MSGFLLTFLVALFSSALLLYLYFKLGSQLKIYDVPNNRSSHENIVIRGGGIVLFFINLVWTIVDPSQLNILLSVSLSIGVLTGFMDDFKSLKSVTRFILYLIAVGIILFGVLALQRFDTYIWIPLFVIILGSVNTYNFMDGINGITALYSIVILCSSLFFLTSLNEFSFSVNIISYMGFFVAFSIFNFRKKALMFLGDSGSVTMGLFAAFLVVLIGFKINSWSSIILLSVYGVDSVGTIILRLIKKENILEAHRSHLYQDLVHIKKYNHLFTSVLYSGIQLFINMGLMVFYHLGSVEFYAVSILLLLALLFYFMKQYIHGDNLFLE
jgi:UDP-N-acetylmuramyl pentapeptide phosphotransferase/UDP-N-acetylglucosamine-1-phosphate transferase